ncbi:hypothetical protein ACFV0C_28775 [Streptomyces sp. NPDC059568]|uniref:hypothetical protein n=1 Tax=Streptomyces sp. NPDC059568 TaxID=3346868 RepID=UPI00368ECFC2
MSLSHGLGPGEGGGTPVDTEMLHTVVMKAVVLADTFRRSLTPDSPLNTTATAAKSHPIDAWCLTTETPGPSYRPPTPGTPNGCCLPPPNWPPTPTTKH